MRRARREKENQAGVDPTPVDSDSSRALDSARSSSQSERPAWEIAEPSSELTETMPVRVPVRKTASAE